VFLLQRLFVLQEVTLTPSINWRVASQVITEERVRWAVNSMAPYKSAGEDGVSPALLQKGINYLVTPITQLKDPCHHK